MDLDDLVLVGVESGLPRLISKASGDRVPTSGWVDAPQASGDGGQFKLETIFPRPDPHRWFPPGLRMYVQVKDAERKGKSKSVTLSLSVDQTKELIAALQHHIDLMAAYVALGGK